MSKYCVEVVYTYEHDELPCDVFPKHTCLCRPLNISTISIWVI